MDFKLYMKKNENWGDVGKMKDQESIDFSKNPQSLRNWSFAGESDLNL